MAVVMCVEEVHGLVYGHFVLLTFKTERHVQLSVNTMLSWCS